jgi:uncharacterized protein YggE
MLSARFYAPTLLLLVALPLAAALAQFGGSRAGVEESAYNAPQAAGRLPILKPEVAEAYLTIEGTAEVRVRPTQIRVVLAVTSEADTAQLCQQAVNEKISQLRAAWKKLDLEEDKVVEDFIAVLPRYEWQEGKKNGRDVLIEVKAGFRMQSNLHLAVPDEAAAQAALGLAFEHGVTDIIAFDYGSEKLDEVKQQVRAAALAAAKAKAEILLGAVTKNELPVINVQEQTTVHYPDSLYESFTNVDDQQVTSGWRDGLPRIHAHRPKNTYYRGLNQSGDIQPRELPMHAEITVVSTVRLYYASPVFGQREAAKAGEKK